MKRFLVVFCMLLAVLAAGCERYNMRPITGGEAVGIIVVQNDPQGALDEIYAQVEILGMAPVTWEVLEERFFLNTEPISRLWGNFADGRFGVADVYILEPMPGEQDACRRLLEDLKLARIVEFRNYDVFNSLRIAEEGVIVEQGGYLILIMLENPEAAQEILAQYI